MTLTAATSAVLTALDAVANTSLDGCTATVVRDELRRLKRASSLLEAQLGRLTFAADALGAFIGTGARDAAEWLGRETNTSTRKNRASARLGEAMERSSELADAVCAGRISADQATAAADAAGDLPIDGALVDSIAELPLPAVKPAVEDWRAKRGPERDLDIADSQRARRYLKLTGQRDGMTRVDGLLDPESAAIVRTSLDGIMNQSAFDGTKRSRDQRCADALTQLCSAASRGDVRGGRSNTKLLATVPFETIVERAAARGHCHVGTSLDAETVRRMACDAGIHRVITGPGSSVLDFGRETRLVPENLFLALVARDQRCRWPGCTVRATWCDAHHIEHWAPPTDGATSERNCVLLCHRHHQLAHQPGWAVTGTGCELSIEHPDGTVHVSRPPGAGPPTTNGPPAARTDAPSGSVYALDPEQLTLA
jgi:hypothetical protein